MLGEVMVFEALSSKPGFTAWKLEKGGQKWPPFSVYTCNYTCSGFDRKNARVAEGSVILTREDG